MFEEARAACTYLVSKYAISPTQKDLYPLQDVTTQAKIDQKLYFDAGTFYATLRADYVSFRLPEFPLVRDFQRFFGYHVGQNKTKNVSFQVASLW